MGDGQKFAMFEKELPSVAAAKNEVSKFARMNCDSLLDPSSTQTKTLYRQPRSRNRKHHPSTQYWTLFDSVRHSDEAWIATGDYEVRHRIESEGESCSASVKVSASSTVAATEVYLQFASQIVVSTNAADMREGRSRLSRRFRTMLTSRFRKLGYSGKWTQDPDAGDSALFTKQLVSPSAAKKEAAHLARTDWLDR